MRASIRIRAVLRRCHLPALACAVTACPLSLFTHSAAASYISEAAAIPIASDEAFTLDGTVDTQSDLGWDLTYIDHSDFTEPYFADDLSGSAYFVGSPDSAPYFTTIGGTNNPDLATNQPLVYVGFDNGYQLTAGVPELFSIWLDADDDTSVDVSLDDDSVSIDPIDFNSPTEFQFVAESDTTQEVDFSMPDSDGQSGLWAISATAAVPEPASLGLLFVGGMALMARRRSFNFSTPASI